MTKYSILIIVSSIILFFLNIFYIKISDKFGILKKKVNLIYTKIKSVIMEE